MRGGGWRVAEVIPSSSYRGHFFSYRDKCRKTLHYPPPSTRTVSRQTPCWYVRAGSRLRVAFAGGNVFTLIQTNARGVRMGTSSPTHHYTDAQVEHVCDMRAARATVKAVAEVIRRNPSTAWRWAAGHRRRAPEAVRAVRPEGAELPCHGRGPTRSSDAKTSLCSNGLPRGLHDRYSRSTKCPPDEKHIGFELGSMRAGSCEVLLLNWANNGLAGSQLHLIPK